MSVYEKRPDQRMDSRTGLVSSQLIWNLGSLFAISVLLEEQQSPHSRSGKKSDAYFSGEISVREIFPFQLSEKKI